MPITNDPTLFEFDTETALRSFHSSGLSGLNIISEYDSETYAELYVSDSVIEEVGGIDEYDAQSDLIEEFLRLDFIDRDAYESIVPRAGRAELYVTQASEVLLVRMFDGDSGLFVSISRTGAESLDELLRIIQELTA